MTLAILPLPFPTAVNSILRHPTIATKLAHDGRQPGFIAHPLVSYYGGYHAGELVAVFTAVQFTEWEVEVHGAVLPRAVRHGRYLGRMFLDQVFSDPVVLRATAYVLGTLPSAANWCRRIGFVDEGRRRNACLVDGVPTDVIVLGLTRTEWLAPVAISAGLPASHRRPNMGY